MTGRARVLLALAAVATVAGIFAAQISTSSDTQAESEAEAAAAAVTSGTEETGPIDQSGSGTVAAGGEPVVGPPRIVGQDGFLLPLLEEDGSVATIVADDVVVLEEQPEALIGATSEAGALVSLRLGPDTEVEVGEVLVSGPVGEVAPSGVLVRVVEVEETSDGSLEVAVEPAGLDDVFVQADISVSTGAWLVMDDEGVVPALAQSQSAPVTPVSFSASGATVPVVPVVSLEGCLPDVQERAGTVPLGPVSADIKLGLRPCFSLQVDLDIRIRERVEGGSRVSSLDLFTAVDSDLRLSASVAQSGTFDGSDFSVEWTTPRPLVSGRTPTQVASIGFVPFAFDVGFAVSPRVEVSGGGFELAASLAAGFEQRVRYRTGQGWSITGDRPSADLSISQFFAAVPQSESGEEDSTVSSVIEVSARAEVEVDMQFRIFGFGGPTIRAAPGFSGVLPLGAGKCPRASWVADIPFTIRFAPDVSAQGWITSKLDWLESGAFELKTFELGRRTWPEDCAPDPEAPEASTPELVTTGRHSTAWTGIGRGRGELVYDIDSFTVEERSDPDELGDAEMVFTLSGDLNLDLSAVPASLGILNTVFRNQICDQDRWRWNPEDRPPADAYSPILLLVNPVGRGILRPSSIFSGDEQTPDAPYMRITEVRDDQQRACIRMQAVLDERVIRIPISTSDAAYIRENGIVVVLAPRQNFFSIVPGLELVNASGNLWERSEWLANVEGLPVLRPSD